MVADGWQQCRPSRTQAVAQGLSNEKMSVCVYGGGTSEGCVVLVSCEPQIDTNQTRFFSIQPKIKIKRTSRKMIYVRFHKGWGYNMLFNVGFSFAFSFFQAGFFPPRVFESKTARARRVAQRAGGACWPRTFFAAKGWFYGILRIGARFCFEDCHEELSSQNTRAKQET